VLLLYGMHRADKPPDQLHPLGYGRELYFWSFIVALVMFALGAGVALYEGVQHVMAPEQISEAWINYIVIGCATVFEGTSWFIALREFRRSKGSLGYIEAVKRSKDPPGFIVIFEDSAALIGLLLAFIGTFASVHLDMPVIDGYASIGISVVLAFTALALAHESKGLLIGETAQPEVRKSISDIVNRTKGVESGQIAFTVHLAPDEIVVALNLDYDDELTAPEIEETTRNIEQAIHAAHPDVIALFVKPQAASAHRRNPFGRLGGAARKFSERPG
jgi:cation diffusion facilitator family transporter